MCVCACASLGRPRVDISRRNEAAGLPPQVWGGWGGLEERASSWRTSTLTLHIKALPVSYHTLEDACLQASGTCLRRLVSDGLLPRLPFESAWKNT